jgi:hypothetical protein
MLLIVDMANSLGAREKRSGARANDDSG